MNTDVDTKASERWTITPEEARAEWIELIGPVSPEVYMAGRFGSPLDHLERELGEITGHPTFDRGYTLDQMLVICVGVLVSAGLVEEVAKTTSMFEDRHNREGAPRAAVHWPFCGRGDWALVTAGAEAVSFPVRHVDMVRFILPDEWNAERRIAWHEEESGHSVVTFLSEMEAEGRILTVDPVPLVGYDPFVAVVSTAPASGPGHRHFYMVTAGALERIERAAGAGVPATWTQLGTVPATDRTFEVCGRGMPVRLAGRKGRGARNSPPAPSSPTLSPPDIVAFKQSQAALAKFSRLHIDCLVRLKLRNDRRLPWPR